jgi:hypothetical protein
MRALMLQDMLLPIGTAWAMLKIGRVFDPKSTRKPTSLAKVAAEENSAELKVKCKK